MNDNYGNYNRKHDTKHRSGPDHLVTKIFWDTSVLVASALIVALGVKTIMVLF